MHSRRLSFSLLLTTLLLAGCSGANSWQARTYPASGTISINGKPPENAMIFLDFLDTAPDKRLSRPYAVVTTDGSFTFTTYEPNDGAPAGRYALTLIWPVDPQRASNDRLQGAFAVAEKSPAEVTITKGRNTIPPIALNNVKINMTNPAPNSMPPLQK